MKHRYTWNHISLFAKLCERVDDSDSTTASWINIVEDHHSTTFPFTLWPLSYRTSDVTTSPSICSPVLLRFPGDVCDITVKIYVCNEVIVICVQNGTLSEDESSTCEIPSTVTSDRVTKHSLHHCEDMSRGLLPCNVARAYSIVKSEVLSHVYKSHKTSSDSKEGIKCVMCVGYGFSASIASCLASEIGKTYETQKDFLGLENKLVGVDFVGFSNPPTASRGFWLTTAGYVDNYISVNEIEAKSSRSGSMIPKPDMVHATVGDWGSNRRSKPMLKIRSKKGGGKRREPLDISEYIAEIDRKIVLEHSIR